VKKFGFAREILREELDSVSGLQEYAIEKLGHLALTEQDEIKASACETLRIYNVDLVKPNIKQAAKSAMNAASCRCFLKPSGIECH